LVSATGLLSVRATGVPFDSEVGFDSVVRVDPLGDAFVVATVFVGTACFPLGDAAGNAPGDFPFVKGFAAAAFFCGEAASLTPADFGFEVFAEDAGSPRD
jgi:hypothetical protein